MEARVADVTVRVVVPETLSNAAEMVVEPVLTEVARPLEPAALLMVATDPADELQVTWDVRSCTELSEKIPVAVNCLVTPNARFGLTGFI